MFLRLKKIKIMKGIILAGGLGSRLYPLTQTTSKQLLPVYDKPMIYYPLSILMLAGIRNIALITSKDYIKDYKKLLGTGNQLGISIKYLIQKNPNGLPEAFKIAEKFIKNESVCLILGDNIFYGAEFVSKHIIPNLNKENNNTIFTYHVANPSEFGVIELDQNDKVLSITEKPKKPKSNLAITGLYIFDKNVSNYSKLLKKSKRGETEIIDLIKMYHKKNNLHVEKISRGIAWLDTGTHQNLVDASEFIKTIEKRQGLKIGCVEEIALSNKFITKKTLTKTVAKMNKSEYRDYLSKII